MRRYSKPLGDLFAFKQDFFHANDEKLKNIARIAALYRAQPKRVLCKNCDGQIDVSAAPAFSKLGVEYSFCARCGHLNGAHEDTEVFCSSVYAEDPDQTYASTYLAADRVDYQRRVAEIYLPKAQFLRDALSEARKPPGRLIDFGAGAGHFVSAAKSIGFVAPIGYEPSAALVNFGNAMIGGQSLVQRELTDLVPLIEDAEAQVASLIFVLEHVQSPRSVLRALSLNERIQYVFFSVPIFSLSILIETIFSEVMPRNLSGTHTHFYTERSIRHFCDEFGFRQVAEWWFGLDMADFYRSLWVSLSKATTPNAPLVNYLETNFLPLLDRLQGALDEAHQCTEVHMLLKRK